MSTKVSKTWNKSSYAHRENALLRHKLPLAPSWDCFTPVSNFSRQLALFLCFDSDNNNNNSKINNSCTYFSLAWLSEGTTAPFPLPYILEGVVILLVTCQRKLSGKATISIATHLVLSSSLSPLPFSLFAPVSFFFTSPTLPTNQAGFQSGGNLKLSTGGAFFFSIAVPGFCSRPPCSQTVGVS